MHARRLAVLMGLALCAAVPEALVRADDAQVAFQVWLVIQLLGVIVAAIGVAALFSVLGLGLVRLLTRPLMHRASTFVAWSFLRAPRLVVPWPLRLWHLLQEAVDARPGALVPRPLWQTPVALAVGALSALACVKLVLGSSAGLAALSARNATVAMFLHAGLLACSGLPRRSLRVAPLALLASGGLVGAAIAARHPLVLPYFDAGWAAAALILALAVTAWRAGSGAGWTQRLQHLGLRILLVGLGIAAVAAALFLVKPTWAVIAASVGTVLFLHGLYLLMQGRAKVSLPVFVSIVGVAAGTWALIVVLSVMGGFAADLRAKMLVANAHALIERSGQARAFGDVARMSKVLRALPGVAAVSPQVRGDAILSSAFNVNNFVSIRGIDAGLPEVRRELGATLVSGDLHLLEHPAAMASDRSLARKPAYEAQDLPAAPALHGAAPTEDSRRELEALLRAAPGPAEPAAPQPDPAHMLLLPSGTPPKMQGHAAADLEAIEVATPPPPAMPSIEPPGLDAHLQHALGDDLDAGGAAEAIDIPVAPGILLGAELARSLQVELGDRVEVVTPDGDVGPTGLRPRVRTFRVAGTFETGLYEADSKVAYVQLGEAARYFNLIGDANVLELRMIHPEQPDDVVAGVRASLRRLGAPPDIEVIDWRALNRSLFSALAFERLVIFLVLGLIILVAAFSIVSALTMVILQKHDSIAMLRAMGATAGSIRNAFVQMGGVIGLIGTTAGGILGVGTCLLILHLGIQLPEAYYVRTLPVSIEVVEIAAVALAAVAVSLVATVFPATSAARLRPLEGLRHG